MLPACSRQSSPVQNARGITHSCSLLCLFSAQGSVDQLARSWHGCHHKELRAAEQANATTQRDTRAPPFGTCTLSARCMSFSILRVRVKERSRRECVCFNPSRTDESLPFSACLRRCRHSQAASANQAHKSGRPSVHHSPGDAGAQLGLPLYSTPERTHCVPGTGRGALMRTDT